MFFIVPCPEGFEWHRKTRKCYSPQPGRFNWQAAVDACKAMNPKAKLMEPRTDWENMAIKDLVGMYYMFIII